MILFHSRLQPFDKRYTHLTSNRATVVRAVETNFIMNPVRSMLITPSSRAAKLFAEAGTIFEVDKRR